jgi:uncharacterized protein YecE (DUF72 family)
MIRVGIGGWTFEPWRGSFYPPDLPKTRELEYASRAVTAIEVNGTFYRTQTRDSFRRWADESPDDFVFTLKAPRFAVNRRVLAEAGPSIEHFFASGPTELRGKLGPRLWQLAPTNKFDAEDIEAFLALMPRAHDGLRLRHAIEVRHPSFCVPQFVALARKYSVAIVFAEAEKYPAIADVTSDFLYLRLQRSQADIDAGYAPAVLATVADWARRWEAGGEPDAVPKVAGPAPDNARRDVFIFMISGAKERNPAAAMALIDMLK